MLLWRCWSCTAGIDKEAKWPNSTLDNLFSHTVLLSGRNFHSQRWGDRVGLDLPQIEEQTVTLCSLRNTSTLLKVFSLHYLGGGVFYPTWAASVYPCMVFFPLAAYRLKRIHFLLSKFDKSFSMRLFVVPNFWSIDFRLCSEACQNGHFNQPILQTVLHREDTTSCALTTSLHWNKIGHECTLCLLANHAVATHSKALKYKLTLEFYKNRH